MEPAACLSTDISVVRSLSSLGDACNNAGRDLAVTSPLSSTSASSASTALTTSISTLSSQHEILPLQLGPPTAAPSTSSIQHYKRQQFQKTQQLPLETYDGQKMQFQFQQQQQQLHQQQQQQLQQHQQQQQQQQQAQHQQFQYQDYPPQFSASNFQRKDHQQQQPEFEYQLKELTPIQHVYATSNSKTEQPYPIQQQHYQMEPLQLPQLPLQQHAEYYTNAATAGSSSFSQSFVFSEYARTAPLTLANPLGRVESAEIGMSSSIAPPVYHNASILAVNNLEFTWHPPPSAVHQYPHPQEIANMPQQQLHEAQLQQSYHQLSQIRHHDHHHRYPQ